MRFGFNRSVRPEKRRSGSFVVLFALMNTVLLSFAAVAIDVSYTRSLFAEMQRMADAGAHGMLVAYIHGGSSGQNMQIAEDVSGLNLVGGNSTKLKASNFSYGVWDFPTRTFGNASSGNAVKVDYSAQISLLFGALVGVSSSTAIVSSTAALRPRELVFLIDISTASEAPVRTAAYQSMLTGIYNYLMPEDRVAFVLYNSSALGAGMVTLQSVNTGYAALNTKLSKLGACGTGVMPPCVNGNDPAAAINEGISILQNQGDTTFYQAIYLLTTGDIRCTTGLASCATTLKNTAVNAADSAAALGISVYPIAVQATSTNASFLETLQRGDGLKQEMDQTTVISDMDNILALVADRIPIAIVE